MEFTHPKISGAYRARRGGRREERERHLLQGMEGGGVTDKEREDGDRKWDKQGVKEEEREGTKKWGEEETKKRL